MLPKKHCIEVCRKPTRKSVEESGMWENEMEFSEIKYRHTSKELKL